VYVNDSNMGYPLAIPIVVGTVTIQVSASDDVGIDRVEIYDTDAAGGPTLLGKATYDPASKRFTLFWDAGADTPGLHTLTARALDCTGKSAQSEGQAFVL
jgi:hypothetical protein